ncbi:hypothetical protein A0H81_03592 [Grifola frondosa]|uniref:Uncharacterized protein n=1 Tax=Grifola frondosa TaxID=5627 RepID=A0A1C7MIL8_GRIFR|nr:hypothetical protein A0H81_03592 [Grifola frondosa]
MQEIEKRTSLSKVLNSLVFENGLSYPRPHSHQTTITGDEPQSKDLRYYMFPIIDFNDISEPLPLKYCRPEIFVMHGWIPVVLGPPYRQDSSCMEEPRDRSGHNSTHLQPWSDSRAMTIDPRARRRGPQDTSIIRCIVVPRLL